MPGKTWFAVKSASLLFVFSVFSSTASAQASSPAVPHEVLMQQLASAESVSKAVAEEVRRESAAAQGLRRSDSLWNGAVIGAGVAVGVGLAFCRAMEPWRHCIDDYGPMLRLGALGAGLGLGIDALLHTSRTTAGHVSPAGGIHATPLLGRRKGVQLSVAF
jgi:hypothetical protein